MDLLHYHLRAGTWDSAFLQPPVPHPATGSVHTKDQNHGLRGAFPILRASGFMKDMGDLFSSLPAEDILSITSRVGGVGVPALFLRRGGTHLSFLQPCERGRWQRAQSRSPQLCGGTCGGEGWDWLLWRVRRKRNWRRQLRGLPRAIVSSWGSGAEKGGPRAQGGREQGTAGRCVLAQPQQKPFGAVVSSYKKGGRGRWIT